MSFPVLDLSQSVTDLPELNNNKKSSNQLHKNINQKCLRTRSLKIFSCKIIVKL